MLEGNDDCLARVVVKKAVALLNNSVKGDSLKNRAVRDNKVAFYYVCPDIEIANAHVELVGDGEYLALRKLTERLIQRTGVVRPRD